MYAMRLTERWLDEDVIVADAADDCFEELETLRGQDVEAGGGRGGAGVWEPGVVVVGEGPGAEAGSAEVGVEGVVA
jgi:hypothetical protein